MQAHWASCVYQISKRTRISVYNMSVIKIFDIIFCNFQKSIVVLDDDSFLLSPLTVRAFSELPFLYKNLGDSGNLAKVLVDPNFLSCRVKRSYLFKNN